MKNIISIVLENGVKILRKEEKQQKVEVL